MKPARFLPLLMMLALAACGDDEPTSAEAAAPRPVLTEEASQVAAHIEGFSGTVEPRYETKLAFRTLGRIVSLDADVGDQVQAGAELAHIDAETLEASVRQAKAQLASARAQAQNARASLGRAKALFEKNTVSSADLETAEQSQTSAEASVTEAQADLAKAENALSYAILTAPFAGVITARSADVGQVVSAGETVMTLARVDVREAVVDIPSDLIDTVDTGAPFSVRLQTDPAIRAQGKVREVAPEADALTRTNRVRILLENPPAAFRLGSLISVRPQGQNAAALTVPKSAILEDGGKTFVWVVEDGAVHRREVKTGAILAGAVAISSGLEAGERVVVAGIHSLKEGQQVSVFGEERP
ncbi:efflux RND transporter periplasmic adaptor subunit [Breoghania sp. JC706]|uniref:efflux RND transporter periplasmic adaptor subunit n=1 Tax=Breoghania sp. JC706 TaxID=3117732 RepID=UPI003008BB86